MLDAFIIEEIKRRERLRRDDERPTVDLPIPEDRPDNRRTNTPQEEQPKRGVVVIDLAV